MLKSTYCIIENQNVSIADSFSIDLLWQFLPKSKVKNTLDITFTCTFLKNAFISQLLNSQTCSKQQFNDQFFHTLHSSDESPLYMKSILLGFLAILTFGSMTIGYGQNLEATDDTGWTLLFNGENLDGWKVGDNADSFSVENGAIKVNGPVAHLFYMGEISNHSFENFEFKASVMTKPGANSGIYFHTKYQEAGWPEQGYEVQVNNSQEDWKRTGSLYGIVDIKENYAHDNEWYTEHIKVEGNRVIIKINDTVVVDYTEPENPIRNEGSKRILSQGTFALQAHDPGSTVFYKDIMVKF